MLSDELIKCRPNGNIITIDGYHFDTDNTVKGNVTRYRSLGVILSQTFLTSH